MRSQLVASLVGLWTICVVLPARADVKATLELTRRAMELPNNQIKQKIELYTKAINAHPTYFLPWLNRAACYNNYGLWDKAIEDATQAIQLDKDQPHAYAIRGRAHASRGEIQRAEHDLKRALELARTTEESAQLFNERGNVLYSARQYEGAIKDYRSAVDQLPNFAKAWNNLGGAYMAVDDMDKAYDCFDRALRIDPKEVQVYVNRSKTFVARNDRLMAGRDVNKAVELNPDDASALTQRGIYYFLTDEFGKANADFQQAFGLQNKVDAAIWRYLAGMKQDQGENALLELQNYLRINARVNYWPLPVAQMLAGVIAPEALLELADRDPNEQGRRERLATAHFFIAEHFALRSDKEKSRRHLVQALAMKSPRAQESVIARIVLDGWQTPIPPPPRSVPSEETATPAKGAR